jgi:hypothetical protein
MPCFHTHWLVAIHAIEHAPEYIGRGFRTYLSNGEKYRGDCLAVLGKPSLSADLVKAHQKWEGSLTKPDVIDDVTCFSAYMLGACGPDFWTLPSEPKRGPFPSLAKIHFDLGHYNRTHRQFELSIDEVGGPGKAEQPGPSGLEARVQRSYFLGMATHFAADLVVHQLVNVYAGAYNLLEDTWNNEHRGDAGLHLWNLHNKVEHFWDTYVRYRYLGDYGPFWPHGNDEARDDRDWFTPLGLPTVDGLLLHVPELVPEARREQVWSHLTSPSTRFAVEKPLMFPWLFCDHVLAGKINAFIYGIVVDKTFGAYPASKEEPARSVLTGELQRTATKEAIEKQMRNDAGSLGEYRKLEYFCSAKNLEIDSTSFNFLTFRVCPSVERTQGWTRPFVPNSFYDYRGLGAFLQTAVKAAGRLVDELSSAYNHGDISRLDKLRRHWNLDTGLGLRVRQRPSATRCETISELEFIHVFDELATGRPRYRRREGYLIGKQAGSDYPPEEPRVRAFETYVHEPPFPDLQSISEEPHNYLERIPVENDTFVSSSAVTVKTAKATPINTVVHRELKQRLTLCFRVSIADLRSPRPSLKDPHRENLAMFFRADKKDAPAEATEEETKDWLAKKSKSLDYRTEPVEVKNGLQTFATRILVNTEDETPQKAASWQRKQQQGEWNNVIPYNEHKGQYGHNFAIGTGREFVLHPIRVSAGSINPFLDLVCYKNLSPTEHVFFTLFPLVPKGRAYWDIFDKKDVSAAQFAELRKISNCGTMKIVLVYQRKSDSQLILRNAYVDGLKTPVEN